MGHSDCEIDSTHWEGHEVGRSRDENGGETWSGGRRDAGDKGQWKNKRRDTNEKLKKE